jgi:endonuclease YncB( thermonuclease family)
MRASGIAATLAASAAVLAGLAGSGVHVVAGPAGFAVVDGDTVHLDQESYRLLGIDAAEIRRAQCDAERRLGELTKHRLEVLLESGAISVFPDPPTKRDKYGRRLLRLIVNGEDAACVLITEGYARPWRGRREDWCTDVSLAQQDDGEPEACAATSSVP